MYVCMKGTFVHNVIKKEHRMNEYVTTAAVA